MSCAVFVREGRTHGDDDDLELLLPIPALLSLDAERRRSQFNVEKRRREKNAPSGGEKSVGTEVSDDSEDSDCPRADPAKLQGSRTSVFNAFDSFERKRNKGNAPTSTD